MFLVCGAQTATSTFAFGRIVIVTSRRAGIQTR
jgi:hypothetical protein